LKNEIAYNSIMDNSIIVAKRFDGTNYMISILPTQRSTALLPLEMYFEGDDLRRLSALKSDSMFSFENLVYEVAVFKEGETEKPPVFVFEFNDKNGKRMTKDDFYQYFMNIFNSEDVKDMTDFSNDLTDNIYTKYGLRAVKVDMPNIYYGMKKLRYIFITKSF